jgi:aminopeptidase C
MNTKNGGAGHAVVLINYDSDRLEFLNSWGQKWADNGFFCVKDEYVLENLKFYDVLH